MVCVGAVYPGGLSHKSCQDYDSHSARYKIKYFIFTPLSKKWQP